MSRLKALKGRVEATTKVDVSSDIQKAIELIGKGFELVENGTALEHREGGYVKISKRVQNHFKK